MKVSFDEVFTAEEEEAADLGRPPSGLSLIFVSTPVRDGSKEPENICKIEKLQPASQ